jgi:putative DNA primase/helicase
MTQDTQTHWARLERGGKVYEKKTTDPAVAKGWHTEPKLNVIEHGEGTPPWERPTIVRRGHIAYVLDYAPVESVNTSEPWGDLPPGQDPAEVAREIAEAEAEIAAPRAKAKEAIEEMMSLDLQPVSTLPGEKARLWRAWKAISKKNNPTLIDKVPWDGKRRMPKWQEAPYLTLEEARAVPGDGGVGLVLMRTCPDVGTAYTAVDLDKCIVDGQLVPAARVVLDIARRHNLYVDISPSGRGLHVVGRGTATAFEVSFKEKEEGEVSRTSLLFLTMTGTPFGDYQGDPEAQADEALAAIRQAFSGAASEKKKPKEGHPTDPRLIEAARKMPGATERASGIKFACPQCQHEGRDTSQDNGFVPFVKGELQIGCALKLPEHREAILKALGSPECSVSDYHATDPGIAHAFTVAHGDSVRYDADRACWLLFDGTRWTPDALALVKHRVVDTLRGLQAQALRIDDPDTKKKRLGALIGCENRVPSILKHAESYLGTRTTEWDKDPMLLGVQNGVVDLRTGEFRPGCHEDRITMQAAVRYNPEATCPLWEKTLSEIFANDAEVISYVQRALGYSITGDCREEVFFLATSAIDKEWPGREGKGTLINTVARTMGDYAETLSFKTLEQRKQEAETSPDLAKLVHKRFVTASEASGGHFNEQKIKSITGGDLISCRFLHKNEFTYLPEFKLWLSVNQLPKVRDDAFWSRPHRITFRVSFRGREDRTLKERLLAEREGVLLWLVRGCIEWQKAGLAPPKAVTEAVEEYRLSQEPLADFYAAHCTLGNPGAWTSTADLREAYIRWCDVEKIYLRLGSKRFALELRKRFKAHKETTGRERHGFLGVGLLIPELGRGDQF